MYDIVIVGAGLFAATVCAILKDKYKILVIESRSHIGGNCYDYMSNGTLIHKYGPHIFHSPSNEIVNFLSNFTEWIDFSYTVTAEILFKDNLVNVPFPYSKETEEVIGQISNQEIIDLFFKGYSEKMWGIPFEELPQVIKNRVPKDTKLKSEYFPGQFQGLPKYGYTKMMEKMFDGVDIILGAESDLWKYYYEKAKFVFYCGRPDHIITDIGLDFRSLDISFSTSKIDFNTSSKNICHKLSNITRIASYKNITGGKSNIISIERPIKASYYDLTPYYPLQNDSNIMLYEDIRKSIFIRYPKIILSGRLGTYKYLDMYQVVGQAMAFCKGVKK